MLSRQYIPAVAALAVVAVASLRCWSLVVCPQPCIIDFREIHPPSQPMLHLHATDTRLNAWILAWTQRALLRNPSELYAANIFHPTPNALVGSEHLLGVAAMLLPARLATDDAARLHQAAVGLSFVGTGLSTLVLGYWMTGSAWLAFLAAYIATLLPWRIAELSHVQLLSTTWIPLVWGFIYATFTRGPSARRSIALAVVLTVQLFTSYYLAYFTLISSAILGAIMLVATRRLARRELSHLVTAFGLPVLALVIVSFPYLEAVGRDFVLRGPIYKSVPLMSSWKLIQPRLDHVLGTQLPAEIGYEIPLTVAMLLVAGPLCVWLGRFSSASDRGDRDQRQQRRAMVVGLCTVCAGAFLLSAGDTNVVFGRSISMPGAWLSALIPGFERMRAPQRWNIVVMLAIPILAALGMARIEAFLRDSRLRTAVRVAVLVAVTVNTRTTTITTQPPFEAIQDDLAVYDVVRDLPDGPVLELPWPMEPAREAELAGEYMLASTRHWKPLLNGYTGYLPANYNDLRRLGALLPAPPAVDALHDQTGVRWIVVHRSIMEPDEADRWLLPNGNERLRLVQIVGTVWIYEVLASPAPAALHSREGAAA